MAKKKPPEEHENLERWLVSYGDFITLLFATFVVLYALSQIDLSDLGKLEDGMKKAFNAPSLLEGTDSILPGKESLLDFEIANSTIPPLMMEYVSQKYEEQSFKDIKESVDEMKKNGDLDGVEAKITDAGLVISFKDDFLFYSASATLTDKALKTLDNIGALVSEKFALHYIRVEGHTDNQPINSFLYPSNWELSGARSSSIIRYLIQRFKFMPNLFTSVGYGDTRPVIDNTTSENRAKNRRVEILVLKNKFKGLEHASASILTQSKQAQEKFQKERENILQSVTQSSPELKRLKESRAARAKSAKKQNKVNTDSTDILNDKSLVPDTQEDNSISIKNKSIYEQVGKGDSSTEAKNVVEDDNWLGNTKTNKILQRDINRQFDMVGQ